MSRESRKSRSFFEYFIIVCLFVCFEDMSGRCKIAGLERSGLGVGLIIDEFLCVTF